jgi:cation:H+ antiporter
MDTVSRPAVGLRVVAFGTSFPELIVSVNAALSQQGDISVGNVVASNSFNRGVILDLTALVCPIRVHVQVIRIDAPGISRLDYLVMIVFTVLLIPLLYTGR